MLSGTMNINADAHSNNSNDKDKFYNQIKFDYLYQTNLSETEADKLYNEIKDNGLTAADEEIVLELIQGSENAYLDNVLAIQDQYEEITANLDAQVKDAVDKYYLHYSIKFYEDNVDENSVISPATRGVNQNITAEANKNTDLTVTENNEILCQQLGVSARATKVVQVRIFADPSEDNAIYGSITGTHAWLSIKNISGSNMTIGRLSGIANNKTVSMGTYGKISTSEHNGLWYNLEAQGVSKGELSGRLSLLVELDQTGWNTLQSYLTGSSIDYWSVSNNCSTFATNGWNKVCSSTVSAGTVNTPKSLASSIKSYSSYATGVAVPYDYKVYYANGTSAPIKSTECNRKLIKYNTELIKCNQELFTYENSYFY